MFPEKKKRREMEVTTDAENSVPADDIPAEQFAEEMSFLRAAEHGLARPYHIQYRHNTLRWSLYQNAVSMRVREDGTICSFHFQTSVRCVCQLGGTPVIRCMFKGAHFMAENGHFHDCVSERRPCTELGDVKVFAIPPDGTFELVHYTSRAHLPHHDNLSLHLQSVLGANALSNQGDTLENATADASTLAALSLMRCPVTLCTFANEMKGGQLFSMHVRLQISKEYRQMRQVRCVIPLHPNCLPGSVTIIANRGRALVERRDRKEMVMQSEPFVHDVGKQRRYQNFLQHRDTGRVMLECRELGMSPDECHRERLEFENMSTATFARLLPKPDAQDSCAGEDPAVWGHDNVVSWEIESVGKQTGHTESFERIECDQEATLDIKGAIAAPLIVFPYHQITGEESRVACVPADSLVIDQPLWQTWNLTMAGLHKLDDIKRPFPRDRNSTRLQQRAHLLELKELAESRITSSCLSRLLPPVVVR
jgi:hypothetical protein